MDEQQKKELIKKAMAELGKRSAQKRDKQYYSDLANKRWKNKKAVDR